MKKLIFILVATFANASSFGQIPDSTKNIFGAWKISSESIDPLANVQLEALKKANPAMADQINIETIKESLRGAIYTYGSDGTYQSQMMGQQDAGTWKLSDDKKSLLQTSKTSGRESVRVIVRSSKDKITLKLPNGVVVKYEPSK